jgi:hypothetical protein
MNNNNNNILIFIHFFNNTIVFGHSQIACEAKLVDRVHAMIEAGESLLARDYTGPSPREVSSSI